MKLHNGRGTPDPSAATVLVNDDILWTWTCVAGAVADVWDVEIDIPVKRKLTSADDIRMVEISDTVNGFQSTYVTRALLDCI